MFKFRKDKGSVSEGGLAMAKQINLFVIWKLDSFYYSRETVAATQLKLNLHNELQTPEAFP